jgi:dephospho-CoA kinase
MRRRVFADPGARRRLEAILHPLIRAETDRLARSAHSAYVILMIPLLVESGDPHARCDRVLVVDCPEEEQIRRVMARSGLPKADVEAIMATQVSRANRLAAADDVVDNSGEPAGLDSRVENLHRSYLDLASRRNTEQ